VLRLRSGADCMRGFIGALFVLAAVSGFPQSVETHRLELYDGQAEELIRGLEENRGLSFYSVEELPDPVFRELVERLEDFAVAEHYIYLWYGTYAPFGGTAAAKVWVRRYIVFFRFDGDGYLRYLAICAEVP